MTRRLQFVALSLSLVLALGLPLRPASAADTPAAVVASAPVSDRDLGVFPFLPALEGFEPVPAAASSWTRDGNFIRYHFQYAPEQAVEVGGRFMMRHFAARDPEDQAAGGLGPEAIPP
jgi:hypothetical protein